MKQYFIEDEKSRQQATEEVRLLSSLNHKNILRYKESFIHEGMLFVITHLSKAGDMKKFLQNAKEKGTKLPEKEIFALFR